MREYLQRRASDVIELWLLQGDDEKRSELVHMADAAGVQVRRASRDRLTDLCDATEHQGAVAALREFAYAQLCALAGSKPLFLVAADGIEDPRNLGALIRSAAAAGAGGVIIPKDRAAQVTPTVEKAAAGTTAWCPVARVTNMARSLAELKEQGFWLIGLSQSAPASLFEADPPMPAVLVVGGEAGVRDLVRRTCDLELRIPMAEGVESLNVAVAAAVALFELRRRQMRRATP